MKFIRYYSIEFFALFVILCALKRKKGMSTQFIKHTKVKGNLNFCLFYSLYNKIKLL